MKKLLLVLCAGAIAFSCNNQQTNSQNENQTCDASHKEGCCTKTDTVMKVQSDAFLYESELAWESPVPGLKRQIMGYNDNLMMVKIDFEAGCDGGGAHAHPHSQSSIIVSGVFDVTIDGVTKRLKGGDAFYVAPNLMHMALCIEAGTLIDGFSPAREDFLKK